MANSIHFICFGCLFLMMINTVENVMECKTTNLGLDYSGYINITVSGRHCQKWAADTPHLSSTFYVEAVGDQENYCRNPDNETVGPWCYIMDPAVRWEKCPVPWCSPPTVIVSQTSYSVNVGNTITLECNVTSDPPVTAVHWEKTQGHRPLVNITSTTNPSKYSGSTPKTPSLTILTVDFLDAESYTCFATNSMGTSMSNATVLAVTEVSRIEIVKTEFETTSTTQVTTSTMLSGLLTREQSTGFAASNTTCGTLDEFYSCSCLFSNNTEENLNLSITELIRILTIDKKNTSMHKRKLMCAKDERKSARTIGYIGAVFMSVPFVLIIINDLISFHIRCTLTKADMTTC